MILKYKVVLHIWNAIHLHCTERETFQELLSVDSLLKHTSYIPLFRCFCDSTVNIKHTWTLFTCPPMKYRHIQTTPTLALIPCWCTLVAESSPLCKVQKDFSRLCWECNTQCLQTRSIWCVINLIHNDIDWSTDILIVDLPTEGRMVLPFGIMTNNSQYVWSLALPAKPFTLSRNGP